MAREKEEFLIFGCWHLPTPAIRHAKNFFLLINSLSERLWLPKMCSLRKEVFLKELNVHHVHHQKSLDG